MIGPAVGGKRPYVTSAFIKEALDKGHAAFRWDERKAQSGKRNGSKVRGVGVADLVLDRLERGADAVAQAFVPGFHRRLAGVDIGRQRRNEIGFFGR